MTAAACAVDLVARGAGPPPPRPCLAARHCTPVALPLLAAATRVCMRGSRCPQAVFHVADMIRRTQQLSFIEVRTALNPCAHH